jgi:hypothetical protein
MSDLAMPSGNDTPQVLLEHHLKQLRLPTFLREYDKVARQCAAEGVDYPRFLLRLTELELLDRERRATERRIHQARFPVVKSLDTFEFPAIPSLNKALVLELATLGVHTAARERAIAGQQWHRKNSPRARPGFISLPTRTSRTLHDGSGNGARVTGSQGREAVAALSETDGQLRTADRR